MTKPILSIVSPTREGFSEHWLAELLKVKGDVEFILVHPPGLASYPTTDPRLKQINSAFRGEIIQRMSGLINACGTYTLTINCDEYITPDIAEIAVRYFQRFPDSWVLRLNKRSFKFGDKENLDKPWLPVADLEQLEVRAKTAESKHLPKIKIFLREIPIAPLNNKLDLGCLWRGRKDHRGFHTENFDKKIWKTKMVQETLEELIQLMSVIGPFKYVPFWCLDRLLGLAIQAKFFEEDKIIGHFLPAPEQIRVEDNPPEYKRSKRFYVLAEILLLRRFPQYGYFWNLVIDQLRGIPLRGLETIKK